MTKEDFLNLLQIEHFPEPVLVKQPANGSLNTHTHPFEVKALVIDGSIEIEVDSNRSTYAVGDMFHLTHAQPHKESYGANGVQYLASRKE
jgi:quercetin dioxygenase-like cupin family protein